MFLFVAMSSGLAQPAVEDFKKHFRFNIQESRGEISIDGILSEEDWQTAEVGSDFWQKLPYFAEGADPKTEIRLTHDDNNLYVSAKCYQPQDILVRSLIRDVYWDNDGIAIVLDPLNTRTNSFLFGVTAAGAQWDALRSLDNINADWSNKWYSAVHQGDGFWSMEMAIPFKILRYDPEITEWGMNFVRNHMNENEYHNWTAVPESFWPPDPAFAGALVFDSIPESSKGNFNVIPYVTTSLESTEGGTPVGKINAGLDARLSVSPTLNLDMTFNPDFSQVEADQLVNNLTRFNIFLPERRTFFLENGDLFSDFGYPAVRPFFSRRIGLDEDRRAVPIIYGLRLTGNLNETTRIGAINVHSGKKGDSPAQNQTALAVQKFFGRSFLKGYWLNRQSFDGVEAQGDDFGRNGGLEAAYISNNGQIALWGSANGSWKSGISGKNAFFNSGFLFTNPSWEILLANGVVQENYYTDMGFVQRIENTDAVRDTTIRVGFNENVANVAYRWRPVGGNIARHQWGFDNTVFFNLDGSLNERNHQLYYIMAFRSTAELAVTLNQHEIDLLYPFRFVSEAKALPTDQYRFHFAELNYNSDQRKSIFVETNLRSGEFYNGHLHSARGAVNFRWQPRVNWKVGYEWNRLELPNEFGQETISAIQSRLEVGFNTNLFWTTLFQYLDQSEFLGINSRLQWRFAPMSDLFLVYIDNYDVSDGLGGDIESNNRAVVLKLNYWW